MFERLFKRKLVSVNDCQRLLSAISKRITDEFNRLPETLDIDKDDYISMGELIIFIKQVFKSVLRLVK